MQHSEIATAIATEVKTGAQRARTVGHVGRQGDLVVRRESADAGSVRATPCPDGGWLLAAGAHGEHRAIASGRVSCDAGVLCIAPGGAVLIVHTDVPEARHDALRLGPGRWPYHRSRELTADEAIVVEVSD